MKRELVAGVCVEPIIPLHCYTHCSNHSTAFVCKNEIVVEMEDFNTLLTADEIGQL